MRRFARRVFWPSVIATVTAYFVAPVLAAFGVAVVAVSVIATVGGLIAVPALMIAFSSPRAGLFWQGSYAEPWRAERSPGEWSVIEADRYDRDVRRF